MPLCPAVYTDENKLGNNARVEGLNVPIARSVADISCANKLRDITALHLPIVNIRVK